MGSLHSSKRRLLSQLTYTTLFPDLLSVLHLLSDLPWSRAGRGQANQWKCVQEELVEPAPAGIQGPRGNQGALAAGVGMLRHVHL